MSEVLVTNDAAKPVPVVMTGMPRWEVSGSIHIAENEGFGGSDFTVPANTLFVVTFIAARGRHQGVPAGDPPALKSFMIESAAGTTFKGSDVYPVVRRVDRHHSAICQLLDFVIEGGKLENHVTAGLDKDLDLGNSYTVHYVLQGHLQKHIFLSSVLEPVHF